MNGYAPKSSAPLAYVVGILGALLIVFLLVRAMQNYTQPAALGANRAAQRSEFLTKLRQAEAPVLSEYAWQDQPKGVVRIPIDQAMAQTIQLYKAPASVRAVLIERSDIVSAPPPEVPSDFE